jgi:hypothetical protein
LEVVFTTQYLDVYETLEKDGAGELTATDFEIVIPVAEIVTANLYSLDLEQTAFSITAPEPPATAPAAPSVDPAAPSAVRPSSEEASSSPMGDRSG